MSDQEKNVTQENTNPKMVLSISPETENLPHPCPICSSMGKKLKDGLCPGHITGGGGGGGGGGDDKAEKVAKPTNTPNKENTEVLVSEESAKAAVAEIYDAITKFLDKNLTAEFIASVFNVQIDAQKGILSLQLRPNLTPEQQIIAMEFLEKIHAAFKEFKAFIFIRDGKAVSDFTGDLIPGKGLEIHMPKGYFQEFLETLKAKNLLPIPATVEELKPIIENAQENKEEATKKPRYLDPYKIETPRLERGE